MAEAGTTRPRRDYSMFDAELSGAVLNLSLLRRLLRWMKPYRITFAVSAVLILIASTLQVLQPKVDRCFEAGAYSDSRNASRAARSSAGIAVNASRLAWASPPCHRTASS